MHLDVTYADIMMSLNQYELYLIRDALEKSSNEAAHELAREINDELSTALLII